MGSWGSKSVEVTPQWQRSSYQVGAEATTTVQAPASSLGPAAPAAALVQEGEGFTTPEAVRGEPSYVIRQPRLAPGPASRSIGAEPVMGCRPKGRFRPTPSARRRLSMGPAPSAGLSSSCCSVPGSAATAAHASKPLPASSEVAASAVVGVPRAAQSAAPVAVDSTPRVFGCLSLSRGTPSVPPSHFVNGTGAPGLPLDGEASCCSYSSGHSRLPPPSLTRPVDYDGGPVEPVAEHEQSGALAEDASATTQEPLGSKDTEIVQECAEGEGDEEESEEQTAPKLNHGESAEGATGSATHSLHDKQGRVPGQYIGKEWEDPSSEAFSSGITFADLSPALTMVFSSNELYAEGDKPFDARVIGEEESTAHYHSERWDVDAVLAEFTWRESRGYNHSSVLVKWARWECNPLHHSSWVQKSALMKSTDCERPAWESWLANPRREERTIALDDPLFLGLCMCPQVFNDHHCGPLFLNGVAWSRKKYVSQCIGEPSESESTGGATAGYFGAKRRRATESQVKKIRQQKGGAASTDAAPSSLVSEYIDSASFPDSSHDDAVLEWEDGRDGKWKGKSKQRQKKKLHSKRSNQKGCANKAQPLSTWTADLNLTVHACPSYLSSHPDIKKDCCPLIMFEQVQNKDAAHSMAKALYNFIPGEMMMSPLVAMNMAKDGFSLASRPRMFFTNITGHLPKAEYVEKAMAGQLDSFLAEPLIVRSIKEIINWPEDMPLPAWFSDHWQDGRLNCLMGKSYSSPNQLTAVQEIMRDNLTEDGSLPDALPEVVEPDGNQRMTNNFRKEAKKHCWVPSPTSDPMGLPMQLMTAWACELMGFPPDFFEKHFGEKNPQDSREALGQSFETNGMAYLLHPLAMPDSPCYARGRGLTVLSLCDGICGVLVALKKLKNIKVGVCLPERGAPEAGEVPATPYKTHSAQKASWCSFLLCRWIGLSQPKLIRRR
mmetsp:Transcript_6476/g.18082  ORF Transcript_6476/g.18082 Transcript_6476/m.18082 type:complete len:946 (+) Transcript_6476:644-3481(+)